MSLGKSFKKLEFRRLNKLRLLLVSLTFQEKSKVNSSDNNLKYFTSKIIQITKRTFKLFLLKTDIRFDKYDVHIPASKSRGPLRQAFEGEAGKG
jgi:hypothetical protein